MLENKKIIAKNTLFLYFRMLLLIAINLYTSRVVLKALGVEDYGIYNVVGGVVALFSIFSNSLSAAIARFITFELGQNNYEKLKQIFCTSVNLQIALIIVAVIVLESIGVWFLNCKMVIPIDRLYAANVVYQISVMTFAINLWSVPYNACIIAHERMSAFAYFSLIDALLKLLIAFVIMCNPIDRLVFYAILIFIAGVIQRFLYVLYCRRNFEECKYAFSFDKDITKEMFGFAGWNIIGASSAVLRDHGSNLIVNLFFGPSVNAAKGISTSVNTAVFGFVSNFMTALNPQITKSYASDEKEYMFALSFQGARFSFYILSFIVFPVFFSAPYILEMWLGNVPEHTVEFVRLVLIFALSESLASPLITIMLATGRIRNYQLIVGGLQMLNLPLSYLALKLGFPPESVYYVAIVISVLCEFARLFMLKKMVGLSISLFMKNVYLNVIIISLLSVILPLFVIYVFEPLGLSSFIIVSFCSVLNTSIVVYFIGCKESERKVIRQYILKLKHLL